MKVQVLLSLKCRQTLRHFKYYCPDISSTTVLEMSETTPIFQVLLSWHFKYYCPWNAGNHSDISSITVLEISETTPTFQILLSWKCRKPVQHFNCYCPWNAGNHSDKASYPKRHIYRPQHLRKKKNQISLLIGELQFGEYKDKAPVSGRINF